MNICIGIDIGRSDGAAYTVVEYVFDGQYKRPHYSTFKTFKEAMVKLNEINNQATGQ